MSGRIKDSSELPFVRKGGGGGGGSCVYLLHYPLHSIHPVCNQRKEERAG